MVRWIRSTAVAFLALAAGLSYAQTCTTTISSPTDPMATANGMTSGQVLCLNPGTYTAPAAGFNAGVYSFC